MDSRQTLPAAVPQQRLPAGTDPTADYSLRLRITLGRLCREVVETVEDGDSATDETLRLHAWLRADYIPWLSKAMLALSLPARSELATAMAEIAHLDSLLVTARAEQAATIADRLRRVGTDLVTDIVAAYQR